MKRKFRVYRGASGTGMRRKWDVPLKVRMEQRRKAKMSKDESHEGYHPENLKLQPYPHSAVRELARHARAIGIQFHINGIPFGADYDKSLRDRFETSGGDDDAHRQ